jgi:hypothetical protein
VRSRAGERSRDRSENRSRQGEPRRLIDFCHAARIRNFSTVVFGEIGGSGGAGPAETGRNLPFPGKEMLCGGSLG